ncbi:uncharacterized protein LOC122265842 [Penaeus japonicus]|uniref:uncharacterized protein LOC122265842 n=1 Tax=Penaeus japonicus TaxID=27405 RepID=UPI001C710867|nr:uncharacterized protein LOC122265842 [Penaeus japonicus]
MPYPGCSEISASVRFDVDLSDFNCTLPTGLIMEAEKKWLWKATMGEKFFDVGQRYRTFMVSYQLTLATATPLLEDQVTTALSHLYRKTPNLRACYDERDGHTWLREMTQENIDFEMLPETASAAETLRRLRNNQYDSSHGPLWCAKLRPGPPSEGAAAERVQGFPHLYTFFLGFHHGITDGTSTMKICGFLVQLLNDVISGKRVDDVEQLGVFISGERTQKIVDERVAAMKADPELLQKMINESAAHKSPCSILNSTYRDACRLTESVTVNTAFAALASVAMTDLLALGGLEQDSYRIRGDHVVSVRRYWDVDASPYLGCHILPPMPISVETPRNVGDKFWDFARSLHKEILSELKAGAVIREEALKNFFMPENVNIDDVFHQPESELANTCDFCVSNMGDVTKLVTEGGDRLQATHVLRSVSIHGVPNNWSHLFHTFRGRFIYVLDYNTGKVTTQMAETFCERIFHHLHNVIQAK